MDFIEKLKDEHEQIERELIELETIMDAEELNYPNLVHVYKKLHSLWNEHEIKEEKVFPILKHEDIVVPVKTMLFEHSQLTPHKNALLEAIDSGDRENIKQVLGESGRIILDKLREHIQTEDEVLYRITLENFSPQEILDAEEAIS